MHKLLSLLVFTVMLSLLGMSSSKAQQDPIFGQYVFNSTVINPAQAGVFDQSQWGVVYRNQWAGIEGAPITKSFFSNFRMNKNLGGAFGLYQDQIGPINDVTMQFDIAYPVRLSDEWSISGGLRAMGSSITANLADLQNVQAGDPTFNQNIASGIYFNMGLGLLLSSKKTFIGVSVPKAITREFENQQVMNAKLKQHYFLYGGMRLNMGDNWAFSPGFMARFVQNTPFQMDVNAIFNYKNTLDIGPMLRSKDAVGLLLGVYMNEKWYLGYQYEYPLQDIQQVSQQTHEVALRYLWESKHKSRIRSPRYFI